MSNPYMYGIRAGSATLPSMSSSQVSLASTTSSSLSGDHSPSRNPQARLIPRTAGLDEESLLFARDAQRSQLTSKKKYMASLVSSSRIRSRAGSDIDGRTGSTYILPTVTDNLHSHPNSSSVSVVPSPSSSPPHTIGRPAQHRSSSDSAAGKVGSGSVGRNPRPHGHSQPHPAAYAPDQRRRHTDGIPGTTSPPNRMGHNSLPPTPDRSTAPSRRTSSTAASNSPVSTTGSLSAPTFIKAMNDLFFRRFCQEEVIYAEFKNQLLTRVHKNAHINHPDYLSSILVTVGRASRNVSLDMEAIAQWNLARLAKEKDVSILDRLFLMNLRIMVYDATHDIICSAPHCANPLCHATHSHVFGIQDRASAFGCCLNLLLNDGMHHRIIDRDDKMSVRLTAISAAASPPQRIRCLRELASLLLFARTPALKSIALRGIDRLHYLAKHSSSETVNQLASCQYAHERARLYEPVNPWLVHDLEDLDVAKLARLAQATLASTFLGAIYLLTPADLEVDDMFYFSLLKFGQLHLDYWAEATTITCPMLLHLFRATEPCTFIDFLFQENLPQLRPFFNRGKPDPRKFTPLNRILDHALNRAHDLGVLALNQLTPAPTSPTAATTPTDAAPPSPAVSDSQSTVGEDGVQHGQVVPRLHGFCMNLVVELTHLLSRMIFVQQSMHPGGAQEPEYRPYFSDLFLLDYSSSATEAPWQEVIDHFVLFERRHRRSHPANLLAYFAVAAEQVFVRDTLCDLELFLDLTMELLTEFRKRRPDYEVVTMTRDGLLVDSPPAGTGSLPQWNRRVREEIGGEFDRLFAEAGRYVTQCQAARARAAAKSSRSGSTTSIGSASTVRGSLGALDTAKLGGGGGGVMATVLMASPTPNASIVANNGGASGPANMSRTSTGSSGAGGGGGMMATNSSSPNIVLSSSTTLANHTLCYPAYVPSSPVKPQT
ncbi:hypothetical protein IWQ60_009758 [Tieghemiomyces parasiticus]|uniref:Uncharacterized protein n=1 Tax=Tieghemiomyces parasiticus TaxID=78921 RepID=A0A9W7ZSN8_9FUNG|nr:hypothetical protein IWQ60_009758 [Tieghemiomyces parasiticus]